MTTTEVAVQLLALCREGKHIEAVDTLYADDVVSVEPEDLGPLARELRGKAAVMSKNVWWYGVNDVHSFTAVGPYVNRDSFALQLTFDFTNKESGARMLFNEVALFTVVDGKITREEYFYAAG